MDPLCPSDISPAQRGKPCRPIRPGHTPLASLRLLAPLSLCERGGTVKLLGGFIVVLAG